jgi:hypothetical protein
MGENKFVRTLRAWEQTKDRDQQLELLAEMGLEEDKLLNDADRQICNLDVCARHGLEMLDSATDSESLREAKEKLALCRQNCVYMRDFSLKPED